METVHGCTPTGSVAVTVGGDAMIHGELEVMV